MTPAVASLVLAMKTTISLFLALVAVSSLQAQIYRPQGVHRVATRESRVAAHRPDDRGYRGGDGRRDGPSFHVGVNQRSGYRGHDYGRGYDRHSHRPIYYRSYGVPYRYSTCPSYGYYSGYGLGYPYYDTYGYYGSYGSGSAATNGLLLGALAGGIIGHNSGDFRHNGWRGAAWGAGAGWLLGSIVDANRRTNAYYSPPVAVQQAPAVQVPVQSAAPSQPQQVTIINNYYNASSPMSAANGLFGR
jgi:hypothetical protein